MSLGVGTLNTNRKQDAVVFPPPAPPFALNSADNGLSVDAVSRRIVLGNDVGDAAQPAVLLNDREIPLNGFTVRLLELVNQYMQLGSDTLIFEKDLSNGPQEILMQDSGTGDIFRMRFDPITGGTWGMSANFANSGLACDMLMTDNGEVIIDGFTPRSVGRSVQLGGAGGVNSDGGVQLVRQVNFETASRVINSGLRYYVFTNRGAAAGITLTLTTSSAGVEFDFCVVNANGITLTAQAGETITIGNAVTAAGGSISSLQVGSYIKLSALDDGTGYIATSFAGSWTIAGGVRVGEVPFGTLTATAALDFTNTAAQLSADLTIAVAGAADGNVVALGVPIASQVADTCYTAFVSAPGVVTVRFNNYSAGAADPAPGTFRVAVHQF